MKKILAVFFAAALLVLPASASMLAVDPNQKIHDYATLFPEHEAQSLEQEARAVTGRHGLDVVVVTIDDDEGKLSEQYAADFYDYNHFGKGDDFSGILMLLNMDAREVFILTTGRCIADFTDSQIESLLDYVYDDVAGGNFSNAAKTFINEVDKFYRYREKNSTATIEESHSYKETTLDEKVMVALGGGFGFALVTVLVLLAVHRRSLPKAPDSRLYLQQGGMTLSRQVDRFVTTHTSRRAIPKDKGSTGGSGSSGSSTFKGSSGRSHGGGGRKF